MLVAGHVRNPYQAAMISARIPLYSSAASGLLFAALGAASRYHFRTTETRWQIVAFVGIAAAAEIGWTTSGARSSWFRCAVGAGAAAAAITFAKFDIEPQALHEDRARVMHVVRKSAQKIEHKLLRAGPCRTALNRQPRMTAIRAN